MCRSRGRREARESFFDGVFYSLVKTGGFDKDYGERMLHLVDSRSCVQQMFRW